jgi:hypothetical protein
VCLRSVQGDDRGPIVNFAEELVRTDVNANGHFVCSNAVAGGHGLQPAWSERVLVRREPFCLALELNDSLRKMLDVLHDNHHAVSDDVRNIRAGAKAGPRGGVGNAGRPTANDSAPRARGRSE